MDRTTKALAAAALLVAGSVQAQAIWRCGDSYSQRPCPGGKPVESPAAAPTAGEQAQARANAKRDAALAGAMEKDRLKLEAQAPSAYIPPPRAEPEFTPHKWPEKNATRKLDVFTAVAPGSKPEKKSKAAASSSAGKSKATGAGADKGARR